MKKKFASQSAFFNLRVLIGLLMVLTSVFLALAGLGTFSALAQVQQKHQIITNSKNPLVPNGFDCSKIHQLGIDRQVNFRAGAIMIACGQARGGGASHGGVISRFVQKLPLPQSIKKLFTPLPLAFGAGDVDLVTGAETFPNITQSETFSTANPDNPQQILVAYNDSRGAALTTTNLAGASVSTDGGMTFTRLTNASGQSPFASAGANIGDPVALYNKSTGTWHTIWIDTACGGFGLGGYSSTTPSDPNSWTTHFCVHNNTMDDRPSGWVDNNPSSPFFGRMFVSWNDFNVGGGALSVTFSTDDGATWNSPVIVSNTATFIRDVQITGDMSGNGVVYIAGMDEGNGGFPHNDTNYLFKSTDGGNTWTNTYVGAPFPGPGVTAQGYFACMFPDNGGYWRHEGWGEPAAFNNVVHLVYAQQGTGSDAGDVYYIRSTDGGVTFGTPFKLNSDSTTRPQWQPNLSVSPAGTLFAMWYDGRENTSCTEGDPTVPCYRMWARKSTDNGVTWLPDDTFSDVVTPLPGQPDPNIISFYAGDYDYGSAILTKHVSSWVDGRNAINGLSQQDAFTDRELTGFSVTTTNPACNSLINTQPTDFTVNLSDAADPTTVQASDFMVNGIPANSFTLMNGNQQIIFTFSSTPVVLGSNTMNIPAGAILRASDEMPIFEFLCNFCYDTAQLTVTSTMPPVGGTFSPPAPGDYTYDVNWNLPVDPGSVSTSDLTLTGNVGASVTNVQVINNNMTTEFTVHFFNGGSVTATIGAGSITAHTCNGNATFSGNYTVEGPPPCFFSAGPDMPTAAVRTVGVFFPDNGKFYVMGGRSSDLPGNELTHPLEYDPTGNTWTTKSATYPDAQVNNMACGILNDSGTNYIYCVGGSQVATPTIITDRVFRYNPVTDTISIVAAPWPGAQVNMVLPGGFTVFNNKLYILGGFNVPGGSGTNQIWEFTPTTNVWVQKSAILPVLLGYIPTTTIGSLIYTGGGASISGVILTDTTNSFVYNPVADSINTIASIPRPTSNTRALNFNGLMLVMGGAFNIISNEVDIYDPGTNTWTTGSPVPPFNTARRNFATDTNGTDHSWLSGGYDTLLTPLMSMEIHFCAQTSPTPTPTATATATATATPTPILTPRPSPTPRPRPTPPPRP